MIPLEIQARLQTARQEGLPAAEKIRLLGSCKTSLEIYLGELEAHVNVAQQRFAEAGQNPSILGGTQTLEEFERQIERESLQAMAQVYEASVEIGTIEREIWQIQEQIHQQARESSRRQPQPTARMRQAMRARQHNEEPPVMSGYGNSAAERLDDPQPQPTARARGARSILQGLQLDLQSARAELAVFNREYQRASMQHRITGEDEAVASTVRSARTAIEERIATLERQIVELQQHQGPPEPLSRRETFAQDQRGPRVIELDLATAQRELQALEESYQRQQRNAFFPDSAHQAAAEERASIQARINTLTQELAQARGETLQAPVAGFFQEEQRPVTRAPLEPVAEEGVDEGPSEEEDEFEAGFAESDFMQDRFRCPISQMPMKNPVMNSAGHNYEHQYILQWYESADTDPQDRSAVNKLMLIPNKDLKSDIEEAKEQYRQSLKSMPSVN